MKEEDKDLDKTYHSPRGDVFYCVTGKEDARETIVFTHGVTAEPLQYGLHVKK